MKNDQFLDYYQHLQYGIMFQKLIDLGIASVAWCSKYKSPFFNYAGVNKKIDEKQLIKIEEQMNKLDRKSTVYFENRRNLSELKSFLVKQGYKKHWEDTWMFHDGKDIDTSRFNSVKKVKTKDDLEIFLETFDASYFKNDPQGPYGELGDYIDVARDTWTIHNKTDRVEYFIVYDEDRPVAVSTLTNFCGIGYLSNLGSISEVRGRGFGKVASLYRVTKSIENGNKIHCAATEKGEYPYNFDLRIGFKEKFTAVGYVKKVLSTSDQGEKTKESK